ncbi:hypothetical protein LUU34_01261600 [Aix galericulata]|nr:hypothetical protein LUU34_01261600 [Aix galericulata]
MCFWDCVTSSLPLTRAWQTGAPAPTGASQHPRGAPQAATPSPLRSLRRFINHRTAQMGTAFISTTARHPRSPPLGTAAASTAGHNAPPGRGSPEPPSGRDPRPRAPGGGTNGPGPLPASRPLPAARWRRARGRRARRVTLPLPPPPCRACAGPAGGEGATPLPPGAKMAAPFVWAVSRAAL